MTVTIDITGTPQVSMVNLDGLDGTLHCPMFVCAWCRQRVHTVPTDDHGLPGYVLWWTRYGDGGNDEHLGPFIVHRPDCMHHLEASVERTGQWGHACSSALDEWLTWVMFNATYPVGIHELRPVTPGQP